MAVIEGGFDEVDEERIRLAEADLARTNEFIKGVLTVSAALRGSAITLWLALLGFALNQHVSALALLAIAAALVMWVADVYHGWLYAEALKHARSLETLLSDYYSTLSRYRDNPRELTRFRGKLRAQRLGLFLSFHTKFEWRSFLTARPAFVYRVVYPALMLIALGIFLALVLGWLDSSGEGTRHLPRMSHCGGGPESFGCRWRT